MENILIGLGVLLAIFGPLLLIPIIWVIYRLVTRPLLGRLFPPQTSSRKIAQGAIMSAIFLITGALAHSYIPGKYEYDAFCGKYAEPRILETVNTEGFYRNRVYNYDARKYLEEGGFMFVEGPFPAQPERFRRYSMNAEGEFIEREIDAPTARYGVRDELWETDSGVIFSVKTVYDMSSNRELARAARLTYSGGYLSILLGSYATTSCPDIRTEQGSNNFRIYYDLEKVVLNSQVDLN